MTLARLWAFLAVGLPVLASLIGNLSAVDLAYHLRAGEITLDTGRIPVTDTFTFTAAGATWLGLFAGNGSQSAAVGINAALVAGVYPFALADVIKVVAAAAVVPGLWRLAGSQQTD